MKSRTGKECKKERCKNYSFYCDWGHHLGYRELLECMECKHSHVSQYQRETKGETK